MALESFDKLKNKNIQIVPIGINYLHHQRPMHKLTMVFGDPISVADFYEGYKNHEVKGTHALKEKVEEGMKKCLWIPEESKDYLEKKAFINRKNENIKFSDFKIKLSNREKIKTLGKHKLGMYKLGLLFGIFNFLPLLLLQKVLKPIRDIVFYGSLKYAFGLFVFPLWWILVFIICLFAFNFQLALIIVFVQFVTLIIRQLLIKWSNQVH
jgi:1-acyl-sn-glycerol-3-phosphate acyltransferase